MSRLSTIAEEDYEPQIEHFQTVASSLERQHGPPHHAHQGLVRSGRLQLDGSTGQPALMVIRHLDHNLPLHAVAPLRAAGIIPGRVEAAVRNLEDFAIWIDEQDVVIMDRETREEVEAQSQHLPSPPRQPLREMSLQEVATRSNVQIQAAESAMVEVEDEVERAGSPMDTVTQKKENRRSRIPVGTKPLRQTK